MYSSHHTSPLLRQGSRTSTDIYSNYHYSRLQESYIYRTGKSVYTFIRRKGDEEHCQQTALWSPESEKAKEAMKGVVTHPKVI